jgi:hypothetical protein
MYTYGNKNDKDRDKKESGQKLRLFHAAVRVNARHATRKKSRPQDQEQVYKHTT